MAQDSSEEDEEGTHSLRPVSRGDTPNQKSPTFTGAAFAEVVRATMKANEEAAATAKTV